MDIAWGRRRALQHMTQVLVLAPVLGLVSGPVEAAPGDKHVDRAWHGWHLLGEARAARKADRDVIRVQGQQGCRAIRLRVLDAPVEFLSVRVWFRNGQSHEVEVRQLISRGSGTRVIDLPGQRRLLDRVVFWYKTPPPAGKQARVQLWARK